jgi:hypothetical protein
VVRRLVEQQNIEHAGKRGAPRRRSIAGSPPPRRPICSSR